MKVFINGLMRPPMNLNLNSRIATAKIKMTSQRKQELTTNQKMDQTEERWIG